VELMEMYNGSIHWMVKAHELPITGHHVQADCNKLVTCDTKGSIVIRSTPAMMGADSDAAATDSQAGFEIVDQIDCNTLDTWRMRVFESRVDADEAQSGSTQLFAALGGKESDLQLWDLGSKTNIWKAKNVCHGERERERERERESEKRWF
jgi:hypothetical protein